MKNIKRTLKADVEVSDQDFGRTFWQFTVCLFNCFADIDVKVKQSINANVNISSQKKKKSECEHLGENTF